MPDCENKYVLSSIFRAHPKEKR